MSGSVGASGSNSRGDPTVINASVLSSEPYSSISLFAAFNSRSETKNCRSSFRNSDPVNNYDGCGAGICTAWRRVVDDFGQLGSYFPGMRLAAIDVGSNSLHMIIADVTREGHLEVVDRVKEMVRLGRRSFTTGRLTEESMDLAIRAL